MTAACITHNSQPNLGMRQFVIADREAGRLLGLLGCLAKVWSSGDIMAGGGHITLALLDIGSPKSSTNSVGEAEQNAGNWNKLDQSGNTSESSIWSNVVGSKLLSLLLVPSLQAEVSGVCGLSAVTSLDEDEDCWANNWDEVEWQVHEVANESCKGELLEWATGDLGKAGDATATRLELASVGNNTGLIAGEESAVKDVEQSVLHDEVAGQHVDNCGGLGENEEDGSEWSQWAVGEEHEGD